jgi:hypothetical protein
MKTLRVVWVLLVALVLGLSFAVPAEDVPDTAYDESEALPYESIPVFSSAVRQVTAWTLRCGAQFSFPFYLGSLTRGYKVRAEQSEWSAPAISGSLIILDHCLRR